MRSVAQGEIRLAARVYRAFRFARGIRQLGRAVTQYSANESC